MKKADEMEIHVNFKAVRLSWAAVALFLIIWNVFELISTGDIPLLPFMLMSVQSGVFFWTKLVLNKRMTKAGSHDE